MLHKALWRGSSVIWDKEPNTFRNLANNSEFVWLLIPFAKPQTNLPRALTRNYEALFGSEL